MLIIGFDPGYAQAGVVMIEVDEDGYHVMGAAIVYPDKNSKTKSLEKVESMCLALETFKKLHKDFFDADLLIIEAQQHYARNMSRGRNTDSAIGNTLIRMGKVSGVYWGLTEAPMKHYVLPRTWNKGRSKGLNNAKILECLSSPPEEWDWVDGKPKKKDFEHAIDAAGLAIWGYEEFLLADKSKRVYNIEKGVFTPIKKTKEK